MVEGKCCVVVRLCWIRAIAGGKAEELRPGTQLLIFEKNPANEEEFFVKQKKNEKLYTVSGNAVLTLDMDNKEIYWVESHKKPHFIMREVFSGNGQTATLSNFPTYMMNERSPRDFVQKYAYLYYPALSLYAPVPSNNERERAKQKK